MEEVVAGGGCGQVKGIGNLRYSERLARVAIADCMSLVYRDFTPSAIYAFFPATAQQSATGERPATGPYGQATGPFASERSTKRGTTDTPTHVRRQTHLCAATQPLRRHPALLTPQYVCPCPQIIWRSPLPSSPAR